MYTKFTGFLFLPNFRNWATNTCCLSLIFLFPLCIFVQSVKAKDSIHSSSTQRTSNPFSQFGKEKIINKKAIKLASYKQPEKGDFSITTKRIPDLPATTQNGESLKRINNVDLSNELARISPKYMRIRSESERANYNVKKYRDQIEELKLLTEQTVDSLEKNSTIVEQTKDWRQKEMLIRKIKNSNDKLEIYSNLYQKYQNQLFKAEKRAEILRYQVLELEEDYQESIAIAEPSSQQSSPEQVEPIASFTNHNMKQTPLKSDEFLILSSELHLSEIKRAARKKTQRLRRRIQETARAKKKSKKASVSTSIAERTDARHEENHESLGKKHNFVKHSIENEGQKNREIFKVSRKEIITSDPEKKERYAWKNQGPTDEISDAKEISTVKLTTIEEKIAFLQQENLRIKDEYAKLTGKAMFAKDAVAKASYFKKAEKVEKQILKVEKALRYYTQEEIEGSRSIKQTQN